jgi:hypothetical protein
MKTRKRIKMTNHPLSFHVSPNGRYFLDPNGQPFFFLGDTEWEFFRMYTPNEAAHILRKRKSQGFNVILVMLLGVQMGRIFPERGTSNANLHGELPWEEGDPLKPNEGYFEHIDTMIRLGEANGMTFIVGVFHQWHVDRITLEKARPWARWVAQRYRAVPNLVWSMYPRAEAGYIPVCRELAAGLQEGDGGAHLISVHPDPSVASSSFMHEEPWLAFNMIQTCIEYERIIEAVSADYQRIPAKPVVMAEGGYEGIEFERLQTAYEIRQQAYWSQLAGGYHVYGHNDSWQRPRDWQDWIDAPGAENMKVFRQVITSLPEWWQAVPDQSLFAGPANPAGVLNAAFHSANGEWALAYLSQPCPFTFRLPFKEISRGIQVSWVDPRSGDRLPVELKIIAPEVTFNMPPGWQDALLLMES